MADVSGVKDGGISDYCSIWGGAWVLVVGD